MELLAYIKTLGDSGELEAFAVRVGTTVAHLRNVAYGTRIASAALAAQIEIETCGKVPVSVLRPKDWGKIWDPRRNHLVNCGAIVSQNAEQSQRLHSVATAGGPEGAPPVPDLQEASHGN